MISQVLYRRGLAAMQLTVLALPTNVRHLTAHDTTQLSLDQSR